MKIKSNFMLREIAGTWLVVPISSRVVDFNGMITLSDTGAFLWKQLAKDRTTQELLDALLTEYDVDKFTAISDLEAFISQLKLEDLLEMDKDSSTQSA